MNRILTSRLIACITLGFTAAHSAYGRAPDFSDSIADSKKQHIFRKSVRVTPDHFEWEGHKVVIAESWMEGFWLMFKFEVDGKRLNQNKIQEKENKFLRLDREVPEPGYEPYSSTLRRGLDNFLGGTHGDVRYFMRLKQPEPNQIKLKVRTTIFAKNSRDREKQMPSDTILTFHLHEPGEYY